MKGIIFTESLEMAEKKFSYEMVDTIIDESELPSSGIYTSIGTYHHSEIIQLLGNLSKRSEIGNQVLLKAFGEYLFDAFLKSYPQFFNAIDDPFDFLISIDNHMHVEILKLYPDTKLPKFDIRYLEDGSLEMICKSERKMAALAEGLIETSIAHYHTSHIIKKEMISTDGSIVKFTIKQS